MIKERHFKVHPNVLGCLLHLRLRTELGVRASDRSVDKPELNKKDKHMKGKKAQPVHLSKKAKKALKEQKEIHKELREAEAEVDKEERKTTVSYHTIFLARLLNSIELLANGNAQASLCVILSHPQKPNTNSTPPFRAFWHIKIRSSCQH